MDYFLLSAIELNVFEEAAGKFSSVDRQTWTFGAARYLQAGVHKSHTPGRRHD
jgi:hypothetical protein